MRTAFLFLALTLVGCGGLVRTPRPDLPTIPPEALDRPLAPEALREDAAFLLRTLGEVHPAPFALTDEAAARASLDSLVTGLDAPLTRLGLWRRLAPWAASLGDGHTSLGFPRPEYDRWRDTGGALFPLPVEVRGDTLRLTREASGVPACTAVLSINGRDARGLVRETRAALSGETDAYRDYSLGRSFGAWAWAATGLSGPYEIALASGDTLRLAGTVRVTTAQAPEAHAPALVYTRLDDGTGWLRVLTFARPLADFERELEATFQQIRDEGTEQLLVDVRENGGGNSLLGDALLSYLTDQPTRNASRVEWRRSRQYGRYVKGFVAPAVRWAVPWGIAPQIGGYFRTPIGQDYVREASPPQPPEARGLRFEGDWAVLIGTRTFSSGMLFALAVKDHGVAPLVGQETGGQATGYGEVYTFALPHSGLTVRSSTKRFVRPNGSTASGGVVPDVEVPERCGDAGDPTLERAVRLLREEER